jgi:hypothetical protein
MEHGPDRGTARCQSFRAVSLSKPGFGLRVGGEEGLDPQLLERHVLGCAEGHDGAEEANVEPALPDVNREEEVGRVRLCGRMSGRDTGITAHLSQKFGADRVVADMQQLPHGSPEEMSRHFVPVDDRALEAEGQARDRGREKGSSVTALSVVG